jgi:hypothetical protein
MRKNREDEQIHVIMNMYMGMSQETPCIAILNKQKYNSLFTRTKNRKAKQVLSKGVVSVGGRYKERM